ncbi:MAG TPA: hypothetical protein VFR28_11265 [Allosphingosinicella sp.]|nr:hypothetical protein [Allosphingosinicella sp.]
MRSPSFLVCAAFAAAAVGAPAMAASAAEDVADISNRACLAIATGRLSVPNPASAEFEKAAAGLGLKAGIDRKSLDMFGPATSMISRAAMAHRTNGDSYIVFTTGGALPGCRVILLSEPSAGAMNSVAEALVRPVTGGWRAFPEMTGTRGPVTKRVFLRRDESGRPYLLNLIGLNEPIGKVQLYTTVVAVPAGVALPKGF